MRAADLDVEEQLEQLVEPPDAETTTEYFESLRGA